jgi:hypothetical protein
MQLGRDLRDLALVVEPRTQSLGQPGARGPRLAVERREPATGELGEDALVAVRDQGAQVVVGERESGRRDER